MPASFMRPRRTPALWIVLSAMLFPLVPPTAHAAMSKYRAETMRVRGQSMKALSLLWRQQPVHATEIGVHRYDGLLASYAPAARTAQIAELNAAIAIISKVDASVLTPDDKADRALILSNLSTRRMELVEVKQWQRDPAVYADECVNGVYFLRLRQGVPASQRYADAMRRVAAIPRVVSEMRANVTNPAPCLAEAAAAVFAHGADYLESAIPALASEAGRPSPSQAATVTAATSAMRAAARDLHARAATASGAAGMGRALYEKKLRTQYFASCSVDSVLRLSERILAGKDGSYRVMEASIASIRSGSGLRDVVTPPSSSGEVVVVDAPEFMQPVLGSHAMVGPAPFEQPYPGERNVPGERLRAVARSTVFATGGSSSGALRDAYAPQHVQLTIAGRLIDPVRKAQQCESSAGWAIGSSDARLAACRAIVDVHMQTGDWSVAQAETFLRDRAGLDADAAAADVRRSCHEPGAAAAALVGREQIATLRKDYHARNRGGSDRQFNDALLACGAIPPPVARDLLLNAR